jgi:hypothetical protein
MLAVHPFFLIGLISRSTMIFDQWRKYMKIMPRVIAITSVVLFAISFGAAAAQKNRIEITDCECDEVSAGVFDCTIDFNGAAPANTKDDYHAHVTTEQDGVLDGTVTPASCKAQTDCQGIAGAGTGPYIATCTGAPSPDPACTATLEDDPMYFFGIVAKVATDADPEAHGKATRVLKDNYPNCTINYLPL